MSSSSLPQPLVDSLQAVNLPAAWGHLRGLQSGDPAVLAVAISAFATVSHMRVLAKRAKPMKVGWFLMDLRLTGHLAGQFVDVPDNGEAVERGCMRSSVLHLCDDPTAAPEVGRDITVPVPVGLVCGRTLPALRALSSYWEESRRHPQAMLEACADCQQHALSYAEAWTGLSQKSVISPWMPLEMRNALVQAIAAAIPSVLDKPWTNALGQLADAVFAEFIERLAARVVLDGSHEPALHRSPEYDWNPSYSSDDRICATARRLKLLRNAADNAGHSGPLLSYLTVSDWERVFTETRGSSALAKVLSATIAAKIGDPMLIASVI